MDLTNTPLLTDLYQLNMLQAYLEHGQTDVGVFELFVRKLPRCRQFLMTAGLEQALQFLEQLRFAKDEIEWLEKSGRFSSKFLEYLEGFHFTGDVHAMPEGTIFFPNEPIIRVTAPLPEAQLVESRLINILHFQCLIASKASRFVLLAPNKVLVDFGLRRAHGAEAGLMAARASYISGFSGTATLLAEKVFGIPSFGTMAHSYIQAHDDELEAFENFARSRPENLTLLIDTYDTEAAARKVVALAKHLRNSGISVRAVRLDSGDMIALSKSVRQILDDGDLRDVSIFASGGLDEEVIQDMINLEAPIDGFGIGTSLSTCLDAPAFDCAYKLQEYAGIPRRKRSKGKATWPGRKQVWRQYDCQGMMLHDVLSVEDDAQQGEPLLRLMMRAGKRVEATKSLPDIRKHAIHGLAQLPEEFRNLDSKASYEVRVADALVQLTEEVDRRLDRNLVVGTVNTGRAKQCLLLE